MSKDRGSKASGGAWTHQEKSNVWNKANKIPGVDPNHQRRDKCGSTIQWSLHGVESTYGWEIDHIKPRAKGGGDELSNLQALQWETNRRKSDTYPWNC